MAHETRNQSLPVENDYATSGEAVTLEKPGDDSCNIRIRGASTETYDVEVSDRDVDSAYLKEQTGLSEPQDLKLTLTERFVRVIVNTGSGTGSETADVLISSGGAE